MSNDVSVTIDVANQSIISSDPSIIGVPTKNFEIVTFDNKPCIRAANSEYPYYATFTINPAVKGFSCDIFLQAVSGFTLLIEFDTILNTKYSLVYYPNGTWWNPDRATFDSNNVLVGVWVTVTYSSTDKTITFDNGTTQLIRAVDSSIVDLSVCTFDGSQNIYLTNLGAEMSSRYLNGTGLSEVWTNTKNYISAQLLGYSQTGHTHSASDITSGLAIVATSGSYNDLSNKPTIPSKTSDLTNDSGFITRDNTKIPLTGTNALAGSIVPSTDNSVNLGDSTYGFASFYVNKLYLKGSTIFKLVDDSFICLGGATAQANGANLVLNGKNRSTSTGEFKLEARDGTNTRQLIGKPDGTLSWNGNIIPSTNNAYDLGSSSYGFRDVITHHITIMNNAIERATDDFYLSLRGSTSWNNGGAISVYGKNSSSNTGAFRLEAHNGTTDHYLVGRPDGALTWDGSPITYASDRRIKDEIESISDDVLNAWENLEPKQYKYKSDLETDKENAQVHYGWIAQDVESIIKGDRKGEVKNSLWLHEEWEEQAEVSHEEEYQEEVQTKSGETETVTKTRKVIDQPYREKGDSYGLRYTECLVVECAYLRKKLKELTARIEQLEKGNNVK